MNTHKNARLSFEGRKLLIERIETFGLVLASARARLANGMRAISVKDLPV